MKTIIIILAIFSLNDMFSQNISSNGEKKVDFGLNLINEKNKSKIIVKNLNDNERYQGSYLGQVRTKLEEIYYIIGISYIYNLKESPTAESHIFIYNSKKKFIGNYYLSYTYELPTKLEKNKLYFENKDCKEKKVIDFENGIQKEIILKCNNVTEYYDFNGNVSD